MKYLTILIQCLIVWILGLDTIYSQHEIHPSVPQFKVTKMSFLISVSIASSTDNDPWCAETVKTPLLVPGKMYNSTEEIKIGKCDHGSLRFDVRYPRYPPDPKVSSVVDVRFNSSVIDNPPTCSVPWNGTYINPKPYTASSSSLPGCYIKVVQPAWDIYIEYSFYFKLFSWEVKYT